jgi:hypothetical protein
MKLYTVWIWWNRLRFGLSKKFVAQGVQVRSLPWDDLSDREQQIVYDYWQNLQLTVRSKAVK